MRFVISMLITILITNYHVFGRNSLMSIIVYGQDSIEMVSSSQENVEIEECHFLGSLWITVLSGIGSKQSTIEVQKYNEKISSITGGSLSLQISEQIFLTASYSAQNVRKDEIEFPFDNGLNKIIRIEEKYKTWDFGIKYLLFGYRKVQIDDSTSTDDNVIYKEPRFRPYVEFNFGRTSIDIECWTPNFALHYFLPRPNSTFTVGTLINLAQFLNLDVNVGIRLNRSEPLEVPWIWRESHQFIFTTGLNVIL